MTLRATTWNHARGVAPLAAAGQVFADLRGIRFEVRAHAARVFGEGPLDDLAREFDVVVFDHPLTGAAADHGLFLPLDEWIPADAIADCKSSTVGNSFRSYQHGGRPWGLPIDAACLCMALRGGITEGPVDWEDLMEWARAGRVAQPFSRMSTTGLFFGLCGGQVIPRCGGALDQLRRLFALAGGPPRLGQGAIELLREMSQGGATDCIPACYGYSIYSRQGFAPLRIRFAPSPCWKTGAVLGGAGAAVSAFSGNKELAAAFVAWLAGADCQRHVYSICAGQPAHAEAWDADLPNALTGGFYRDLRPAMESGWTRPNSTAFHQFQSALADRLHAMLRGDASPCATQAFVEANEPLFTPSQS
jgi:multiple sugar transport system substrate-binding protein